MLKLLLIFFAIALNMSASVEFHFDGKTLRHYWVLKEIEKLSQSGKLGRETFCFPLECELLDGESNNKSKIDFFHLNKETLEISFRKKALLFFDWQRKKPVELRGAFEDEEQIFWGRGAGVMGKGTGLITKRRSNINEYLWNISFNFQPPSSIQSKFLRLIEISTFFNIEFFEKKSKFVISFDKYEKEEVAALKKINWQKCYQLKTFEELPQVDSVVIECCREVGKHTRYVVRLALPKSNLPEELKRKYANFQ